MTLPVSGAISFAMINVELNRAAGTVMSLHDADVRVLAGKTSGPVSLSDFYGKSNRVVRKPADYYVERTVFIPDTGTASISFNTDGSTTVNSKAGTAWTTPVLAGIGSSYWFKYVVTSGSTPTTAMTANTWYPLSSARSLSHSRTASGSSSSNLTISIATDSGGATVVATGVMNLLVMVET